MVVEGVLHLLGKEVGSVDGSRDVFDDGGAVEVRLTDFNFVEVDMIDALVSEGRGPVYDSFAFAVDCRSGVGIVHIDVHQEISASQELWVV